MAKNFNPPIKREENVVTVTGFAQNVGIQSIEWKDDYHRIVIEYVNDKGQTQRENLYDKNYAAVNWKTEVSKRNAIQYQINAFARLCQLIYPSLQLADTADLQEAYEMYVSQIQHLLPSPCQGELKLVCKETRGKFYNFKVSKDLPTYSLNGKPELKFTDNDKALLTFTVEEPQPDAETPEDELKF